MSKLVIVESPTKVKSIRKYLGSDCAFAIYHVSRQASCLCLFINDRRIVYGENKSIQSIGLTTSFPTYSIPLPQIALAHSL